MNVIEFNSVWKKFKKGEKLNSIRDALPNFFKKRDKNVLESSEFWAVKDVNFKIKKGEVVGVMGPNGAGKSTILKLLSRIIIPTKGDMVINGRLSALIEVTAGFHPELTGRENVYLNGTILGMRRKEIDQKFDEIVEFSGVSEFIDTPVKRYSSGMYSRLGFSVAAHMDPEILLVDEVLAVGDIAFQAKCARKMRELLGSGATIVLVSHQLAMIQSLCKRVLLLQSGQLIEDGETEEVIPKYQNIVFKNSEDEIRKKMAAQAQGAAQVDTRTLVDIKDISLLDDNGSKKDMFAVGEPLTLALHYSTRDKIESPIFSLEIVRSDGIVCCVSRTDDLGVTVDFIQGEGTVVIRFAKIILAPGIYMVRAGIWDKEMIHPYIIRNKDVLRVQMGGRNTQSNAVFIPDVTWEIK